MQAAGDQRVPNWDHKQGDVIVTTIDAATVLVKPTRIAIAALSCLIGLSLAGCETSNNILNSGNGPVATNTIVPPATVAAPQQATTRITIAPVIGPSDAVGKQLVAQLTASAERQKITVNQTASEPSNYTLRGYFVAPTKDKSNNKLSYIWDVTDPSGKRVNRIAGEEAVAPVAAGDSWAAVSPQLIQAIADKTASSLAAWLPTQAQSSTPIASAQPPVVPVSAPAGPASAQVASAVAGSTGSIAGGAASALLSVVPKVTGAPGDGNTSLAAAMRRELEEKGVQFPAQAQNAYRVVGDVKIKPPKDGNQAISINWTISDPKGAYVAKITQNNDIPAGYLDKTWGQSAEDAAKAASVQIKEVITNHQSGKPIQFSASGASKAQ